MSRIRTRRLSHFSLPSVTQLIRYSIKFVSVIYILKLNMIEIIIIQLQIVKY